MSLVCQSNLLHVFQKNYNFDYYFQAFKSLCHYTNTTEVLCGKYNITLAPLLVRFGLTAMS